MHAVTYQCSLVYFTSSTAALFLLQLQTPASRGEDYTEEAVEAIGQRSGDDEVRMHIHTYIHTYIRMYVCMYVRMYKHCQLSTVRFDHVIHTVRVYVRECCVHMW